MAPSEHALGSARREIASAIKTDSCDDSGHSPLELAGVNGPIIAPLILCTSGNTLDLTR